MDTEKRLIRDIGVELRRPLMTILGTIDLIAKRDLPEWLHNQFKVLTEAAQDLELTADNLMGYCELLQREQKPSSVSFSLQRKLQQSFVDLKARTKQRRYTLQNAFATEALPEAARYKGDPVTLGKVLSSVVNTAMLCCDPPAAIKIDGGVEIESESLHQLVLRVSIPKVRDELRATLSERAKSCSDGKRPELRLADPFLHFEIACALLAQLGGRVLVRGTESLLIELQLPLSVVAVAQAQTEPQAEQPRRQSPPVPRVALLVEDDKGNAAVLQELLLSLEYEVHLAEDGLKAVELFAEREFGLVLMDCQLPGIDGIRAAELIRESEKERGTRTLIIGLSASPLEKRRVHSSPHFDTFLLKPIGISELEELIRIARNQQQHPR